MERWEVREELYGPAFPWSATRMMEWELVGDLRHAARHRAGGAWADVRTRDQAERVASEWNREHPLGEPTRHLIDANGLRHAAGCTPRGLRDCYCFARMVPRRVSAPLALPGSRRRIVQTSHPRWCCCAQCMAWWDDVQEAGR